MTKKTITVSVEVPAYEYAREKGLNISKICSEALENSTLGHKAVDQEMESLQIKMNSLKARELLLEEKEKAAQKEKEEAIEDFKTMVRNKKRGAILTKFVPNEVNCSLNYWSRLTSLHEGALLTIAEKVNKNDV